MFLKPPSAQPWSKLPYVVGCLWRLGWHGALGPGGWIPQAKQLWNKCISWGLGPLLLCMWALSGCIGWWGVGARGAPNSQTLKFWLLGHTWWIAPQYVCHFLFKLGLPSCLKVPMMRIGQASFDVWLLFLMTWACGTI